MGYYLSFYAKDTEKSGQVQWRKKNFVALSNSGVVDDRPH